MFRVQWGQVPVSWLLINPWLMPSDIKLPWKEAIQRETVAKCFLVCFQPITLDVPCTCKLTFIPPHIFFILVAVALSPDEPVTLESLISLVQLTEFVTLMPRFTASVPSSWVEVQQDQQRLHQHTLLDPVLHTRTWKLRSENSR